MLIKNIYQMMNWLDTMKVALEFSSISNSWRKDWIHTQKNKQFLLIKAKKIEMLIGMMRNKGQL